MDIISIQCCINPLREFDYSRGWNGEIYLFHYGCFVSACENWHEVEEEQWQIIREGVAIQA